MRKIVGGERGGVKREKRKKSDRVPPSGDCASGTAVRRQIQESRNSRMASAIEE